MPAGNSDNKCAFGVGIAAELVERLTVYLVCFCNFYIILQERNLLDFFEMQSELA